MIRLIWGHCWGAGKTLKRRYPTMPLVETMVELARDGIGIVLIEQVTSLALKLTPRAYVLERGSLGYSGSSGVVALHRTHPAFRISGGLRAGRHFVAGLKRTPSYALMPPAFPRRPPLWWV